MQLLQYVRPRQVKHHAARLVLPYPVAERKQILCVKLREQVLLPKDYQLLQLHDPVLLSTFGHVQTSVSVEQDSHQQTNAMKTQIVTL